MIKKRRFFSCLMNGLTETFSLSALSSSLFAAAGHASDSGKLGEEQEKQTEFHAAIRSLLDAEKEFERGLVVFKELVGKQSVLREVFVAKPDGKPNLRLRHLTCDDVRHLSKVSAIRG